MTRHVILRSPEVSKRQPLLESESEDTTTLPSSKPFPKNGKTVTKAPVPGQRRKKVGEVAGGAAAECAAVSCCCPCAVVNLVLLAVVRLPAAVCKKALRRGKRCRVTRKRKGYLAAEESAMPERVRLNCGDPTAEILLYKEKINGSAANDVVELEKEMWDHFHGAGFWRSPSQREEAQ